MSLYVIESLQEAPRRKLFTLLGVEYQATPLAWISLVYPAVIGIIVSFIALSERDVITRILTGIAFGLCINLVYFIHGLGHILSGRLVSAPMQANLITATVFVNQYTDTVEYPSWVHIGRTLGGPIANAIAGVVALVVYNAGLQSPVLGFFAIANLLFTTTILPLPAMDGIVIVRELRDWKPRR